MECSRLFEHRPLSQFVYDHDMKPREKSFSTAEKEQKLRWSGLDPEKKNAAVVVMVKCEQWRLMMIVKMDLCSPT